MYQSGGPLTFSMRLTSETRGNGQKILSSKAKNCLAHPERVNPRGLAERTGIT